MMASHTQQLMEEETWAEAVGEWARRLKEDFGVQAEQGRVPIKPLDLVVDYDLLAHSGAVPGSEDPNAWIQAMQVAGQIPQLAGTLAWDRIFKHWARQMGAKNIDDFINDAPTPQVMPDEQVQQAAQQGNAVPVGGDGAAI